MFPLKRVNMAMFSFSAALLIFLAACDEEERGRKVKEWIENINKLKIEAEEQVESIPYGRVQHEAFKNYFSKMNEIILNFKDDNKWTETFRTVVDQNSLQDICSKAFIKRSTWEKMMRGCQQNRFFLCSEEVKSYPESLAVFKKHLSFEQQKKFNETEACRMAQMRWSFTRRRSE